MADMRDELGYAGGLNRGRMAAAAMHVCGAVFAVVVTVWGVASFYELSRTEETTTTDVVGTAALLLGGWAAGLLLWGAAELLRRMEDMVEGLPTGPLESPRPGAVPPARPGELSTAEIQTRLLQQVAQAMGELRDISLLSEQERSQRAHTESTLLAQQLVQDVPALLREHKWREALLRVQRARARFPSVPAWATLAEQVEQARAKFEEHDIETATREIEDLAALNAWDRAAVVVRELKHRHPQSEKVTELVHRVEIGLDRSVAEERARLMSQAQDATNRRKWPEALRLVETVIERFPHSAEAHDLRQQLPTLRLNAEIQTRQNLETAIRDLIKEHQYPDALRRARELIDRYPDSPQATVLREQLPRLEEKAGPS